MATERLPMRIIREILRQKWQLGRSNRAVARSVGLNVGAIGGTLHRARAAGLVTWAAVEGVSGDALAARLYARRAGPWRGRPHARWCATRTHTPHLRATSCSSRSAPSRALPRAPPRGQPPTPQRRTLPPVAAPPRAHDASGPSRRREELRRLRGHAAVPDRSRDGRAAPRGALRD